MLDARSIATLTHFSRVLLLTLAVLLRRASWVRRVQLGHVCGVLSITLKKPWCVLEWAQGAVVSSLSLSAGVSLTARRQHNSLQRITHMWPAFSVIAKPLEWYGREVSTLSGPLWFHFFVFMVKCGEQTSRRHGYTRAYFLLVTETDYFAFSVVLHVTSARTTLDANTPI